jgi:hypothetical protein
MADARCREEEDHALVWMQERPERTREYPEAFEAWRRTRKRNGERVGAS